MRNVEEELDADRLMEEYMFLGLRMISGVSAEKFNDYFGHSIYDIYGSVIDKYKSTGHLEDDHGLIRLTKKRHRRKQHDPGGLLNRIILARPSFKT